MNAKLVYLWCCVYNGVSEKELLRDSLFSCLLPLIKSGVSQTSLRPHLFVVATRTDRGSEFSEPKKRIYS